MSEMSSRWILVVILFSAACGLAACVSHQYHLVKEKKNWTEAQSYCRQVYTDLATITSMDEIKTLMNTVKKKTTTYTWIGLKNFPWYWKWSLSSTTLYLGNTYQNWNLKEPNNQKGNEECVAMLNGKWTDINCNTAVPFVCYEETSADYKTYMLINASKTWSDAQLYCRNIYTDLAIVTNDMENQRLKNLAQPNSYIWIGLFRDSWKWCDGSNSSFRYWRSDQPDNDGGNEHCAEMAIADSQWHDGSCEQKLSFICYGNKLILINQNLTWREALEYCTANYDDLVSVYNEEIQGWLVDMAQNASTTHVWLGLAYSYNMGFWYWVNRGLLDYRNWAPGNGMGEEVCSYGKRFGAMQSRGKHQWVSRPETERLNFICTTN